MDSDSIKEAQENIAKLQSALDEAQRMLEAAGRAQEAAERADQAAEQHAAMLRTVSFNAVGVIALRGADQLPSPAPLRATRSR